MKRKAPQFLIRYANNKLDRIWNDDKRKIEMNNRTKIVNSAVLDYECATIEIDDCMRIIAEV